MTEMFGVLEDNARQAKEKEQAAEAAYQRWLEDEARRRRQAMAKADDAFGLRIIVVTLLGLLLRFAVGAEMMTQGLATFLFVVMCVYLVFYCGAWYQYRYGKDGVLHVSK